MSITLWTTITAYLAFVVGLGLWSARRVKDGDDFLVAGRDVAWPLLFCTMGATAIGGGYSVGAVGKTYDLGLLMVIASTGGYLHFVFSGLVVAPKFRRAQLYTVAGYFEHRFGRGPRLAALVLSLSFSVFVIAAQMAAIGNVVAAVLPDLAVAAVLTWAIVIGGVLVIIYSTAGGLRAVILTDVFQFIILFVGFAVTAALAVPELANSWEDLSGRIPGTFFSAVGSRGWPYLVSLFFAFLLGETFAPAYVTRYCSGRSTRDIRLGIGGVGAFLALTFPFIIFVIALLARVHHPDIEPDRALATVIRGQNHPLVAGIIIAALLSAVMSSADSALNSTTAIFIKDILEHRARRAPDPESTLRSARICTVVLGAVSITVAVAWPAVLDLLLFTYHIWAPGIILPIVIGATTEYRSPALTRSIFITMVLSPLVALLYRQTELAATLDPAVVGVAASIVLFGAAFGIQGLAARSPRKESHG